MADDQVEEDEGVLDVQASLIADTYHVYSWLLHVNVDVEH
jgi:hypothetical protein